MCANVGDSRACMKVGDEVIDLSEDHKPSNTEEQQRITRSKNSVRDGRVNGILAVSRSIGDYKFK